MKISVVIPVYNSSQIIGALVDKINETLCNYKYEIIMVNDFSLDKSWPTIKKICKANNNIKGINLSRNFGQHNAVMAGLNYCTGNVIVLMDDDLQHPPKSIINLIEKINNGYDVCYTNYINRKHPVHKIFLSKLSNIISSLIINKPINLYLSSFKCINLRTKNILVNNKNPIIYIDGKILEITNNITSVDIMHQSRQSGKSNYNLRKLIILWFKLIYQIKITNIKLNFNFVISIIFKILLLPIIFIMFIYFYNKKQYVVKEIFKN